MTAACSKAHGALAHSALARSPTCCYSLHRMRLQPACHTVAACTTCGCRFLAHCEEMMAEEKAWSCCSDRMVSELREKVAAEASGTAP